MLLLQCLASSTGEDVWQIGAFALVLVLARCRRHSCSQPVAQNKLLIIPQTGADGESAFKQSGFFLVPAEPAASADGSSGQIGTVA